MSFEEQEIFDKSKTKVLKFILYKKRSEQEVRKKFAGTIDENMLDDIIQYLKDAKYIDDKKYIERTINDFKLLKNLSMAEIRNKLIAKGIKKDDIEDYFYENEEDLQNYELKSIENIANKKKNSMEIDKLKNYLFRKGYKIDNVKLVFEELEI